FTTIKYALDKSKQATWYYRRPRSLTRLSLGVSWPRTGRPLSGREHNPKRDLCPHHDGRKTIANDVAHIKYAKVLCMTGYD
ncbi:hypothetical protein BHM03_00048358, partial [Ensete ventricosum]